MVLKGGMRAANPMAIVSLERERNERDRVLTADEFRRLSDVAALWLKFMMLVAYHTGMRQGEIRSLRWEQVDLKTGTICLKSSDTKTDNGHAIPLNQTLTSLLKTATRYMRCPWVFVNPALLDAWQANPEVDPRYRTSSITQALLRACRQVGVTNATFHDLRHTFVTNMRRAGVDYFRVMAMTVFKRYNTVDEQDLRQAMQQMDTYMDTTELELLDTGTQMIEKTDLGR